MRFGTMQPATEASRPSDLSLRCWRKLIQYLIDPEPLNAILGLMMNVNLSGVKDPHID
jgi:hypothetical protein